MDQCSVCGEAQDAKDLYLSHKLSELLNQTLASDFAKLSPSPNSS